MSTAFVDFEVIAYPSPVGYSVPMTTTPQSYTLTDALSTHGVHVSSRAIAHFLAIGLSFGEAFDAARADAAREAGLIWACLGCASVGGIDVTGMDEAMSEPLRVGTRDAIDFDAFECCPDDTTIVF